MCCEGGITITTDPPQPGANDITLEKKGQFVEFESNQDFVVSGSGPISVGHYMTGSNHDGFEPKPECAKGPLETGIGDPAFTLTPPTFQLRSDYIVLTP